MRPLFQYFVLLALAFLLASCGAETPSPAVYQHAGAVWQTEGEGQLRHLPSGVIFPESTEVYKRGKVTDFAEDGSDIGLGYSAINADEAGFHPEVTLYVTYGPGMPVDAYLGIAADAIVKRFPDAKLIAEDRFTPETANPPQGPVAIYRVELGSRPYRTGVWVSKKGDWLLKARFTYPERPDPLMAHLETELNKAVKDKANQTRAHVKLRTSEGIPLDMTPVAELLHAVIWGAPKP